MKRVDLETAPHDVRVFVENLPADSDGVELTVQGEVIWRLMRPGSLTDAEKQALLQRGRDIVREVRERTRSTPARTLEKRASEAVDEVRHRQS